MSTLRYICTVIYVILASLYQHLSLLADVRCRNLLSIEITSCQYHIECLLCRLTPRETDDRVIAMRGTQNPKKRSIFMKFSLRNSAFFMAACCLFALAPAAASAGDTIKIGVAGAHSGQLASYGLPTLKAVQIIAEKVNADGGINGKQIEILSEDDLCKPEIAVNSAKKLISDGVDAVIGHTCSGPTSAVMPLYKEKSILVISPSATTPGLTKDGQYPNFFRTVAPDDAQAQVDVDFILDTLGAKKIALLDDKGDYGKSFIHFAKEQFEKDGRAKIVLEEGITQGAVDYSAIVQKIKRSKADVVLYGGYHPEASKIVTTMRKKRMKTYFVSDDGIRVKTFIDVAKKYAEGVYASSSKDTTSNPLAIQAIEEHKKKFGSEPGEFYLNAYTAMVVLVNAIDKADSTELSAVANALRSETVDTPMGHVSFDEVGDATGIGYAVSKVVDGEFVEQK